MKERNNQVEGIRGLGALMIVLFHYLYRYPVLYNVGGTPYFLIEHWGTVGVALFFVISGYYTFSNDKREFSVKKFFSNKFINIYIPYAISVVLVFTVVRIVGLDGRSTSILDAILNLLCINGFISVPYVEGAHWYMTYLLVTYLYICIIKKFKFENTIWVLPSVISISLILKVIGKFSPEPINHVMTVLSGGNAIISFLIGVQIYKGEYPKVCVNLQTGKSILHQFEGLHKLWDTPDRWFKEARNNQHFSITKFQNTVVCGKTIRRIGDGFSSGLFDKYNNDDHSMTIAY